MTEETYKGYTIEISIDEEAEDPMDNDNLVSMCLEHRRYNFPNDTDYKTSDYSSWEEMADEIRKNENILWIERVDLYDHSGLCISLGRYSGPDARWDSWQIGWAFLTKEKVRENFGVKRITKAVKEKAIKMAECEIKEWGAYVAGECCMYRTINPHGDQVDACSGFYDYDYCLKCAQDEIEYIMKQTVNAKADALKKLIKNKVGLEYRQASLKRAEQSVYV